VRSSNGNFSGSHVQTLAPEGRRPARMPPTKAPLGTRVAEQIAEAIIRGEFMPGQWLTEEGICHRYSVSRSPVREAFRALATEGLVNLIPHRGASVARYDAGLISALYECRALLEPECFRLAVPLLTSSAIQALQREYDALRQAAQRNDPKAYLKGSVRFHEIVHAACPNVVLRDLIRILWRRVLVFRNIIVHVPGRLPRSVAFHKRLYQAAMQHDARAAAKAMRDLVHDSHVVLQRALYVGLPGPGQRNERKRSVAVS
jgi:DNA-binding GntR family transcriptional regulator